MEETFTRKIEEVFFLGGNMYVDLFSSELFSLLQVHNPSIRNNMTLNPSECFATGIALLGNLIQREEVSIHPSAIGKVIFPSESISAKINAIGQKEDCYSFSIHPQCCLDYQQSIPQDYECCILYVFVFHG